jgi:hypothetical protein
LFVRCDDPSSHFSTVAMKIENRLSTLTNKIKKNLSLLGDGCSLLTFVNNKNYYGREILLLGSVRESIMTPSETSSEKISFRHSY